MPVFVWSSVEDIEDPRRKNLCSTEPYAAIIRAQSELRSLIKQYDELLHKRWDLASEEQKARIGQLGAQADKLR